MTKTWRTPCNYCGKGVYSDEVRFSLKGYKCLCYECYNFLSIYYKESKKKDYRELKKVIMIN